MSAIEACRTAALGGHVRRCEDCAHVEIAYNSCRNRHCPKCQAAAAHDWLEARRAELLPVAYYHVVFTLPAPIADFAYTNKAVVYDALFKAASEALLTIAADPKHLGAKIGVTMVLHTWGSALTHHPHVHCVVPGGGLSPDGERLLVSCDKSGIFNVYALDIDSGALEQLTHSTTNAVFSVDFFPNDERFLYTADQGGNELNHLFVQPPDGDALDLTPGDDLKAMFTRWGADEKSFFALTNERDPQFFDLYRYRFGPAGARLSPPAFSALTPRGFPK